MIITSSGTFFSWINKATANNVITTVLKLVPYHLGYSVSKPISNQYEMPAASITFVQAEAIESIFLVYSYGAPEVNVCL